ncbi:hypothetical protein SCHPADRAFT_464295 [Schizopora paradoxa]|uniref:Uncharacterized protein n=1 Tax=Schizopora paradoxa TaxID=27342 RepID=A0A0H2S3U8_9AGAM|nr:hypothetical protein SCHPADRAFT_464295 [Schizopora paradoxa]
MGCRPSCDRSHCSPSFRSILHLEDSLIHRMLARRTTDGASPTLISVKYATAPPSKPRRIFDLSEHWTTNPHLDLSLRRNLRVCDFCSKAWSRPLRSSNARRKCCVWRSAPIFRPQFVWLIVSGRRSSKILFTGQKPGSCNYVASLPSLPSFPSPLQS